MNKSGKNGKTRAELPCFSPSCDQKDAPLQLLSPLILGTEANGTEGEAETGVFKNILSHGSGIGVDTGHHYDLLKEDTWLPLPSNDSRPIMEGKSVNAGRRLFAPFDAPFDENSDLLSPQVPSNTDTVPGGSQRVQINLFPDFIAPKSIHQTFPTPKETSLDDFTSSIFKDRASPIALSSSIPSQFYTGGQTVSPLMLSQVDPRALPVANLLPPLPIERQPQQKLSRQKPTKADRSLADRIVQQISPGSKHTICHFCNEKVIVWRRNSYDRRNLARHYSSRRCRNKQLHRLSSNHGGRDLSKPVSIPKGRASSRERPSQEDKRFAKQKIRSIPANTKTLICDYCGNCIKIWRRNSKDLRNYTRHLASKSCRRMQRQTKQLKKKLGACASNNVMKAEVSMLMLPSQQEKSELRHQEQQPAREMQLCSSDTKERRGTLPSASQQPSCLPGLNLSILGLMMAQKRQCPHQDMKEAMDIAPPVRCKFRKANSSTRAHGGSSTKM